MGGNRKPSDLSSAAVKTAALFGDFRIFRQTVGVQRQENQRKKKAQPDQTTAGYVCLPKLRRNHVDFDNPARNGCQTRAQFSSAIQLGETWLVIYIRRSKMGPSYGPLGPPYDIRKCSSLSPNCEPAVIAQGSSSNVNFLSPPASKSFRSQHKLANGRIWPWNTEGQFWSPQF
jgi:hypothetical protein